MATLRAGGSSKRQQSLRGAVVIRSSNGKTYAQAWPRPRGTSPLVYQRANVARMSIVQNCVKLVPAEERRVMYEGLEQFLHDKPGVRSSAAIRLRDWLTSVVYGRSWALTLPTGHVVWPQTVAHDASDYLDWLEPRLGSLLVRTRKGWLPTVQCKPGAVLLQVIQPSYPSACPPASYADYDTTMGGI